MASSLYFLVTKIQRDHNGLLATLQLTNTGDIALDLAPEIQVIIGQDDDAYLGSLQAQTPIAFDLKGLVS